MREVVLIHEDMTDQMRADEQRRAVETERERLLLEAQNAQAHLQATSRVKDEFVATLSHELRTPLNAMLGWAKILRTRPLGDQTAHAVTVIERNAVAQARLIDDLLDLSRIITGKTRLALEPVDVRTIASEAVESMRPAAEGKRIALTLDVEDPLPKVMADSHRLQQILWNLLSNAIKFTEDGGTVVAGDPGRRAQPRGRGDRHRDRCARRYPPEGVRPVHPGRLLEHARPFRTRSGPCDRPLSGRTARRHGAGAERGAGQGRDVRVHVAAAELRQPVNSQLPTPNSQGDVADPPG